MKLATVWVAVLLLATVTPEHTSLWLKLFASVPLVYAALAYIQRKAKP